ncbi:MAG: NEW3 domain-containing protein [Candidatus Bathyarchaeia archaeon]
MMRARDESLIAMLVLIGVTLYIGSQLFSVKVQCAPYYTVYGIVVDEAGVKLSGVLVQVYSSSGAFIDQSSTDSDGYFALMLESGQQYKLCFSKAGYAKVEKTINVVGNMNVSTITLPRALKLYCSALRLVVSLGSKITIPFTVSNEGDTLETVEFIVYKPSDWSARILDQYNHEITDIYLPPSSKQNLQLELCTPSTASVDTEYGIALAAIGTLKCYLTITVYVKPPVTVSGRLVDEMGNAVENAIVDVYSSDGFLVKSATSGMAGYFTIELGSSNSYMLYFSKPGYVKYTKSIMLGDENLDLGEIVLQRKIQLYSSTLELTVEPGRRLSIPFTIKNSGEDYETVKLSTENPEDWIIRTLTQNNREASRFILSPKENLNLQLEVTVPSTVSIGEYTLRLIATNSINSSLEFKVKIQPLSENIVFCQFPGKTVTPGNTAKFQVKIKNPTDVEQRFSISINPRPPGWGISVKSSSGEAISDIMLDGGGSADLIVEVSTPSNVNDGEYDFLFTAKSQTISGELLIRLIVERPKPCIELTAVPPYLDVYAGSSARFKIKVSNTGGYDQLLNLTAEEIPDGLRVWFEDANKQEITRIYVETGSSKEFYVAVSTPKEYKLGLYSFTVSVADLNVRSTTDLTLNVIGLYRITITTTNFYTSLSVGGETTFDVTVKNAGTQEITNVRVVAVTGSIPDGFTVDVTPSYTSSLKADEDYTFTVTIKTEADVNAGNYYIDFNVLSDQAESKTFTLRVEVFHGTSWIIYGGALIVVAVIGLLVVYRKIGRR